MSQAMKRFPYATFAAAIVIFYGCREQERTAGVSAAKSSKLNGAPVDENPANDWVVSFDDGALPNARMLCSGILITPNRVLTSAHCLFPESGGDPNNPVPTKVADTFNVHFGPHFDDPTQLRVTASPKNIVVHPNALPNIFDNYDLAIFKLDRRVGVTTSEQHIIPRRPQIFTPPDPDSVIGGVARYDVTSFGYGLSPYDTCSIPPFLPPGSTAGDRRSTEFFATFDPQQFWTAAIPFTDPHLTGGDSGGPLIQTSTGDVIGVAHLTTGTTTCENHWTALAAAPGTLWVLQTMLKPGPGFGLATFTLHGEDSADPGQDGDRVDDDEDNCPLDYNPDQSDRDFDGIGDVCDSCPGTGDDLEQKNANFDAELANYDDVAHDSARVPFGQDDPVFLQTRETHYQGDACETKAPLVRHGLQEVPFPCPNPKPGGCAVSTWTSEVSFDTVVIGGLSLPYDYGFRFCRCDPGTATSTPEGRRTCRQQAFCSFKVQEENLFDDKNLQSKWLPITIDGQKGGVFNDVTFGQPGTFQKTWDFRKDPKALDHAPKSKTDFVTFGILMSHVEPHWAGGTVAGLATSQGAATDIPVPFGDRSNSFQSGHATITYYPTSDPGKAVPPGAVFAGSPPFLFCPSCPIVDKIPFIELGTPAYADIFSVTGSQAILVSDKVDADAAALLRSSTGRVLHASEPLGVLIKFQPAWTSVLITPDLRVGGVLRGDETGLHEARLPAPRPRAPATSATTPTSLPDAALVAQATRGRVVLVGGTVGGQPSDSLWLLNVASGTWDRREILSAHRPGKILASTFRFSDDSIYAIEEGPSAEKPTHPVARLVRIHTNGVVSILATWPRLAHANVTLSVAEDDQLLIGFSLGGAHAIIVVGVGEHGALSPRAWTIGAGSLVVAPRLTATWLTAVVKEGSHERVREIQRQNLFPAFGFFGEGWW